MTALEKLRSYNPGGIKPVTTGQPTAVSIKSGADGSSAMDRLRAMNPGGINPTSTQTPSAVEAGGGGDGLRPFEVVKAEFESAKKTEKSAIDAANAYVSSNMGQLDLKDPNELKTLNDAATAATKKREELEKEYYSHSGSYEDKVGDLGKAGRAAATVISKPFLAIDVAAQTAKDAASKENTVDMTSLPMLKYGQMSKARESVTEDMGKVGSFLTNTGLSIADNLYSRLISLGIPAATLATMGVSSAADKMHELGERGESATRAMVRGAVSGGIEALTEKIPLETLADMVKTGGKGVIKNLLKQSGVEAAEEGVAYTLNYIADKLAKDPNATWSWSDFASSVAGGGLSGLFFGLGGTAVHHVNGSIPGSGLDGTPAAQDGMIPVESRTATQTTPSATEQTAVLPGVDTSGQFEAVEGEKNAGGEESGLRESALAYGVEEQIAAQAERLAEVTGREIRFYQSEQGENGYYSTEDQTIWVNAKGADPVAQIVSHELTHSVEFASAYNELSALVQLRLARSGGDVQQMMEDKKAQYAEWGKQLDDRGAMQEVVAEYISKNLLTDEAAITEMARSNPTLVQKIVTFFDGLLAKLGLKGSQERSEIRRMRETYRRALQQAGAGYGVSTDTTMQRMSDAYSEGTLSDSEFDDAVDAVMEEESTAGKSMVEGDPLSRQTSGEGVQYAIGRADGQYSFSGTPPVEENYWNSIMDQGRIPFSETQQPGYAKALLEEADRQHPNEGRLRDVDPSEYTGAIPDTKRIDAVQEVPVEIDNLPAKGADYLKRAERAMMRTMEKSLHLSRTDHLPEIVRSATEEYLRTGDISQETAESMFAQMWNEGTSTEDVTDPFFQECAKAEFADALAKLRLELREVKRYARDRAAQLAREETTVLTLDDVKALYPKLKEARRKYERVQAVNLLTAGDTAMVNRLLRGDAEIESIDPTEYNVKGIRAVYEAKQEYEDYAKQIRRWNQSRKAELRRGADFFLRTASAWEDKSRGILYSRETMERNVRDIVPDAALADSIVDEYFAPVHDAVADATRTKNTYRERVRELNLSRKVSKADAAEGRVSEAHAVQLLGEAQDSIRMLERSRGRMKERDGKKLEDWKAVVENLWATNPQLNQAKIEGAVEEFRKIYDELFTQMNESRVRNGYEPINYRSGYFPHFQPGDGDGVLVQFGKALGIDTAVSALPTNINGLSHTFRPGITWMGNAQERLGFNTVYDAVEGFDKYIEGCADVIHLTDSIQNLRAFASQMRYRTTEPGIRNRVDAIRSDERLTAQEKEDMIQSIYDDPKTKYELGNFVVELDEYINLLANKKSRADRNMEQALGRDAYNVVKALESRVAANMVAVNPASWLTNFIPLTQGWAGVDSGHMLKGMQDTLKAIKADDGIVGQSSFLTNRRGSDPLVQTWTQKAADKASKPMEWIDNFTAGSLVRARYYQNVERGMSESLAMSEADAWVAGVMADRSKGSTPTLFNRSNPFTKLFTQFQLEVNNQLSYVFKDIPRDMKDKGVAALAGALLKFALGAFLFDEIYEYFIGRRPALDPIGILNDTVGDITGYKLPNLVEGTVDAIQGEGFFEKKERVGVGQAAVNALANVAGELPFTAALSPVMSQFGIEFDQGRIPVGSALPDLSSAGSALFNRDWSGKKRLKEGLEELAKPVTYLAMPFGGGQMKKFGQGLYATARGGSYTMDAEGNDKLQYPVYNDDAGEWAKSLTGSALFGKTSLPTGREWIEAGFPTLSVKETKAYQNMTDAGISGEDAWEWIQLMKEADGTVEKLGVIGESGAPDEAAVEMFGVVLGTDMETDAGNPTQFAKLLDAMEQGVSAADYVTYRQAIDGASKKADKMRALTAAGFTSVEAGRLLRLLD